MRMMIFIDFWNFQLAWQEEVEAKGGGRIDWFKLAPAFRNKVEEMVVAMGLTPPTLEGVRVYASVLDKDPQSINLANWLSRVVGRIPGFNLTVMKRSLRDASFHCRECGHKTTHCPNCQKQLRRAPEKGVDAAIVTDMLSLAWEGAYDIAVLVSRDADYVPAVEMLTRKGIKVVNAGWKSGGHNLRSTCWAHFDVSEVVSQMSRVDSGK
jgi:uncharacterized LabA/DUF88 family protein